jgi:hypothetical protein
MNNRPFLILGAGGHGMVVADALLSLESVLGSMNRL